ncbi:MAG: RNase adapter RapZ [Elusimicrobia bacterium]|nr:RNase adapter RapZ [Elusimicrobiota bacterium]
MPNTRAHKFFIVTGLSGAGKSQALKIFEDFGFFCVDNLPLKLLPQFSRLVGQAPHLHQAALGIDIRERGFFKEFHQSLQQLSDRGIRHRILFLEASKEVLVQRFSETRHRHPLGSNLLKAIDQETRLLTNIKGLADKVVDTSNLTLGELKEWISSLLELKRAREMILSVVSFGYKHGLPMDSDILLDVRFLPNPHYVKNLRRKTGLDKPVQKFILSFPISRQFLKNTLNLLSLTLPHYVREGKSYLTIAIGCTGGRHRSVYFAQAVATALREQGLIVKEFHRDIAK